MSILRHISVCTLDFSLERKNIQHQTLQISVFGCIAFSSNNCIEFTKFLHILGLIAFHSRITTLLRLFFDLILTLWTPLFKMAHKCSIGLRSGDWTGVFNCLGMFHTNHCLFNSALCLLLFSCWNIQIYDIPILMVLCLTFFLRCRYAHT